MVFSRRFLLEKPKNPTIEVAFLKTSELRDFPKDSISCKLANLLPFFGLAVNADYQV